MNIPKTDINLEALMYALAQQSEPLPDDIQQSLHEIGQALIEQDPEAPRQLRDSIQDYPPLESAYQSALRDWDRNYASQQRSKSSITLAQNPKQLEQAFRDRLAPSNDWVSVAKVLLDPPQPQSSSSQFWEKSDRVFVMMTGGAVIGSLVGQLPGAPIGAGISALWGWYLNFGKKESTDKD